MRVLLNFCCTRACSPGFTCVLHAIRTIKFFNCLSPDRLFEVSAVPETDNCCKCSSECRLASPLPVISVNERLSLRRFLNCEMVVSSSSFTGILFRLSETICSFTSSNSCNCAGLYWDAPKNSTASAGTSNASG